MTALVQDLRLAVRVLLGTKTWTLVVLLSLALGIGANTALFTAVNGLLLQTVSVHEPERLVRFNHAGRNDMVRNSNNYGYSGTSGTRNVQSTFSFPMIEQLRAANTTLTGLAAGVPMGSLNVLVNGDAQLATGYQATGNYFTVIGVPAVLGRVFGEADDRPSAPAVAVISHAYWRKRFAGEPSAIGRVVSINGHMVTLVGVTPADFAGIERLGADAPDVTVPLAFDALFAPPVRVEIPRMQQPTYWWLQLVGRLKPGVSIEQARANFATVFQRTAIAGMAAYQSSLTAHEKVLSTNRQRGTAVPELLIKSAAHGYYDVLPQTRRSAGFLGVVVVLVLLIVCANVANLLLTRATARAREISVRLSIGATRGRLIRQLLTESILLSSVGGALGGLLAYWLRGVLPFGQKAPLDWRVFGFLAGVSMLTGIVFGLLPALRATRVDLTATLKESSRSVTRSRTVLSKGLVVLQVAMSLVLLVGAGLFLRTLDNLKSVDVGFDSRNLLMFNVNPRVNGYDIDRSSRLFGQVLERMATVPGVTSAALTRTRLLSGSPNIYSAWKQGQVSQAPAEENMYMMDVSPTFFATMGIPVLRGRSFTDRDGPTGPKVAILNEAAARRLFPDGDVLGRRIGESFEESGEMEVVGVVRDTKYRERPRSRPADNVSVRLADLAAEPARRAQDRGRAAGDVRDGAGRDARDRPDGSGSGVHIPERTNLAAVRAGTAVCRRLRRVRRARRAARVHRPVRPDELQRGAADQRDRRPPGARRPAKDRGRHGDARVDSARRHRHRAGSCRGPVGRSIRPDSGVRRVARRSPDDRRRAGTDRGRHGPRRRRAGAMRLERESDRRLAAAVGSRASPVRAGGIIVESRAETHAADRSQVRQSSLT